MARHFFCRKIMARPATNPNVAYAMLLPADAMSLEIVTRFSPDDLIRVTTTRPRNPDHHRLFWALCKLIADHSRYTTDQVATLLKAGAGYCDLLETQQGIVAHPHSISYAAMDQTAFEAFWEAVAKVVETELLPGTQRSNWEQEIRRMIA